MAKINCVNGHFYDDRTHTHCPYCPVPGLKNVTVSSTGAAFPDVKSPLSRTWIKAVGWLLILLTNNLFAWFLWSGFRSLLWLPILLANAAFAWLLWSSRVEFPARYLRQVPRRPDPATIVVGQVGSHISTLPPTRRRGVDERRVNGDYISNPAPYRTEASVNGGGGREEPVSDGFFFPAQAAPRLLSLPPEAEPVDAAVYCPPSVARGSVFLVQVFLYPPRAAATVEAEAQQRDPTATERGRYSLPIDVPRGTRIDVRLEMPMLRVEEADAVLVWRGAHTAVQFEVSVPGVVESPNSIGRVRFAIDAVPAGTLRFQVALAAAGAAINPAEFREVQAARYRRAFASYSSQDRAEVLRRVQAFKISGMSVFQDILDLDPGERWEKALYHEIDRCDVFLLFWSKAAAASEWVSKEIDYALARQGGDAENPPAIQPVPIEGPPIVPPPPRLAGLHFNDALLAQIHRLH